ncbi:hypothetical protein Bpfe_013039, partial [Biomphalaria pfeifferi]
SGSYRGNQGAKKAERCLNQGKHIDQDGLELDTGREKERKGVEHRKKINEERVKDSDPTFKQAGVKDSDPTFKQAGVKDSDPTFKQAGVKDSDPTFKEAGVKELDTL